MASSKPSLASGAVTTTPGLATAASQELNKQTAGIAEQPSGNGSMLNDEAKNAAAEGAEGSQQLTTRMFIAGQIEGRHLALDQAYNTSWTQACSMSANAFHTLQATQKRG